jgi:putative flavoprotein involved in K+ transport
VIWATGYRRSYPWLHVPVLDAGGEIRHTAGRTAAPGLAVMGQRWQTRRNSTFLDGVGRDAAIVLDHLLSTVLSERPAEPMRNAS